MLRSDGVGLGQSVTDKLISLRLKAEARNFTPNALKIFLSNPAIEEKLMYTIFRRTTTGAALQSGQQTISYEVDWKGIVIPALPAVAAFGNFIISVGVHAHWWS